MALNIKAFLGKMMRKLSSLSFKDSLNSNSVRSVGGKYWKNIPTGNKSAYLSSQQGIIEDDPKSDNHVGSDTFQATMIGGSVKFLNFLGQIMSERWLKSPLEDYPNGLNKDIEKTTSAYFYEELVKALALYQKNDEIPKSRTRRYDVTTKDNGEVVYKPKVIEWHPFVKKVAFAYYDEIWKGIQHLRSLPPEEQHILIRESIISHVNAGYPVFTQQTKDNFDKLFWQTLKVMKFPLPKVKDNEMYVTADLILDVVKFCINKKLYHPFMLWYRIQKSKHRAVFGAFYVLKMLGALTAAAKKFAFKEDHKDSFLDPIFEKRIFGIGGIPCVAQMNWTQLFEALLARIPDVVDDQLQPMSPDKIYELFGARVPDDQMVDVIGEDVEKYDTSLLAEDLEELRKHKGMGWILGFLIDCMYLSEVWTAFSRVFDVIFKSGHPETSNFGSWPHLNLIYLTRDRLRKKYPDRVIEVLAVSVLSDDDIIFVIGITPEDINETAQDLGINIKVDESYQFSRDHYVGFLKVDLGYSMKGVKAYHGNPFSRYYGLCHSERKINDESPELNDLRGIYKVTGIITIDAIISKLASFGKYAKVQVLEILRIMKDTAEGRSVILAISQISPDVTYELYRDDVLLGFEVNWLATLEVLSTLHSNDP